MDLQTTIVALTFMGLGMIFGGLLPMLWHRMTITEKNAMVRKLQKELDELKAQK